MPSNVKQPPAFNWEAWYEGIGGRSISVPEVDVYFAKIYEEQIPNFHGPVATKQQDFSPEEASRCIKAKALALGVDVVGICEIAKKHLYQGRQLQERYAISLGHRMRWRAFQTVPSPESAAEQARVYYELGRICIELANYIRELGYSAKIGHPVGDSDLLHLPIAIDAGLGELGRHGSLINPQLGPLLRLGTVATSLTLVADKPIDAGIAAFCDNCRACRKFCPPKAIADERSPEAGKDPQGFDRYQIDTGKCFPYFARNYYCGICLPVCAYNHKEWAKDFEGHKTKLFPKVIMNEAEEAFDGIAEEQRHNYPKVKRSR